MSLNQHISQAHKILNTHKELQERKANLARYL